MSDDLAPGKHKLLLVDDDRAFSATLAGGLHRRGLQVLVAHDAGTALRLLDGSTAYAVLDLAVSRGAGLTLLAQLKRRNPGLRAVVLTACASIAGAVAAIRLGAYNYLTKPASAATVIAAFDGAIPSFDHAPPAPLSLEQLEWEHIQQVLLENRGNVSATARVLQVHRRTLQRKLAKAQTRSALQA